MFHCKSWNHRNFWNIQIFLWMSLFWIVDTDRVRFFWFYKNKCNLNIISKNLAPNSNESCRILEPDWIMRTDGSIFEYVIQWALWTKHSTSLQLSNIQKLSSQCIAQARINFVFLRSTRCCDIDFNRFIMMLSRILT